MLQSRLTECEQQLAVLHSRAAGGAAAGSSSAAWCPEAAEFTALERRLDEMAREQVRERMRISQHAHGAMQDTPRCPVPCNDFAIHAAHKLLLQRCVPKCLPCIKGHSPSSYTALFSHRDLCKPCVLC